MEACDSHVTVNCGCGYGDRIEVVLSWKNVTGK